MAKESVIIQMKGHGTMELELLPEKAPITVENFQKLVQEQFYDGLIFHRIIKGFMIQGGDPLGTGMGGAKDTIKGEFSSNGVPNDLAHKRGTISMARSMQKNSASSQFFICHDDANFLDGEYAAFGRLVQGFEELDRLAELATDANDRPVNPDEATIESIRFKEEA